MRALLRGMEETKRLEVTGVVNLSPLLIVAVGVGGACRRRVRSEERRVVGVNSVDAPCSAYPNTSHTTQLSSATLATP